MALRLAFLGTPDFAVPTLAALIGHGHQVVAAYTQPARPRGRGLVPEPSPVARYSEAHGLSIHTPTTLRDSRAQDAFEGFATDAAVVVAYGLLLPARVLEAPRLGCFNLHASLLPRWRGAAPIQRAIMAGDRETGAMVMRMEKGLDTGPVLMAERVAVARKTYGDLHDELATLGAALMARALAALEQGNVDERPQSEQGITYANKISKEETRIDWTRPAGEIDCHIRGLSPRPGAWCEARGERLKILYAIPVEGAGKPGEIRDEQLTVACGEGALRLTRIQRAGRAAADTPEFLRGFPLRKGERL
ncbi:MAG TPA: methionyl-tRNA formyltransferase [Rhizomicrobium sp.]|jgi:methionyl-tRNA formyltransferase